MKVKRGFLTKTTPRDGGPVDALDDMREVLSPAARGGYAEPSKMPFSAWLAGWLDGLRLAPSTKASYRKNVRLHVVPYLGASRWPR